MAHVPTSPIPDVAADVTAVYRRVPAVVAVAMAGSVPTETADDRADIDLYVYAAEPITITDRAAIVPDAREGRTNGDADGTVTGILGPHESHCPSRWRWRCNFH
jgi:hypothetical protein